MSVYEHGFRDAERDLPLSPRGPGQRVREAFNRFVLAPLSGTTLDRWVLLQMVMALALSATAVVCIFIVIDFLTTYESFVDRVTAFNATRAAGVPEETVHGFAARYYLLNLPGVLYLFGPMIVLLGALFVVTRMQRAREFVAAMSAGLSVRRCLRSLFAVVLACCALMLAYNEWGLPAFTEAIDQARAFEERRDAYQGMMTDSDDTVVWLKAYNTREYRAEAVVIVQFEDVALPANVPQDRTIPLLERDAGRQQAARPLVVTVYEGADLTFDQHGRWFVKNGNKRERQVSDYHGEMFHTLTVTERVGSDDVPFVPEGTVDDHDDGGGTGGNGAPQMRPLPFVHAVPAQMRSLPTSLKPAEIGRRKQQVLARLSVSELFILATRRPEWEAPAVQLHEALLYSFAPLILCLLGVSILLDTESPNTFRGLGVGFILCVAYFGVFVTLQGIGLRGDFSATLRGAFHVRSALATQVAVAITLWGGNGIFLAYGLRRYIRMRS